jgi:hypothetical protein
MHRLGAALLVALTAIGCGSDSEPRSRVAPTSTATPRYPVAYRITEAVARRLPEGDALAMIERSGQVIAETEWEDYTALVISAWLEEAHDIKLEAPEFREMTSRLASEQELSVIVVSGEHADALRRLHPREHTLRRYFDRFTEDGYPEAGEAMVDWLRVFRRATSSADAGHVVAIPLVLLD